MANWTLPMIGGCRCDKVRFEIPAAGTDDGVPLHRLSTHDGQPTDSFRVTHGEPVIGGIHGEQGRHHHCDWCKSWLFTRVVPEMGFVNIRATMLDDTSWYAPFLETYTSEALHWAQTGAAHSFAEFSPMEAWQHLIADYAGANAG